MPVNRQAVLQLSLLLLAVPAQYLVTRHFVSSPDSSSRNLAFRRLLSSAAGFRNKYLSLSAWSEWCQDMLSIFRSGSYRDFAGQDDPNGESPAVEVLQFKDKNGYFATVQLDSMPGVSPAPLRVINPGSNSFWTAAPFVTQPASPEPRMPRSGEVKFHIGQVIRHKKWKYRGVIIGWDNKAKAPQSWLQHNHPPDKQHWRDMPNYSILVDTRDRLAPQVTYVPQENIEVIVNTQVLHPNLDNYFEYFDGAQYIPRPWLQALYPQD